MDFVAAPDAVSRVLRNEHGCDFIAALTHMRQPDDERLAVEHGDVDLVLAGHDHSVAVLQVNGRYIVKSGTDFRTFGVMDIGRGKDGQVAVLRRPAMELVTKKFEEDHEMKKYVEAYQEHAADKAQVELALSGVNLDGRFPCIKSRETALGSFIAGIRKFATSILFCRHCRQRIACELMFWCASFVFLSFSIRFALCVEWSSAPEPK